MGWKPFKAITRAFTPPAPVRAAVERIIPIPGLTDPAKIGNAIERAVTPSSEVKNAFKITGESFQPAEIFRVYSSGAMALYTGGLSVTSPRVGGITVVSSDVNKASLGGAVLVGANSLGQVQAGNPDVKETDLNKLGRLFGGAVSSFALGSAATNVLTTPVGAGANALPTGVQGPTQGFTFGESFGNFAGSTISTSASTYAAGSFGQGVLSLFGKQAGTAILQLLGGDIGGAIKTITTNPPNQPTPINVGPSSYSGSSGGGGGFTGVNTGQMTSSSIGLVVVGAGVLLLLFLLLRRKG